jgi:hypothetical protein
MNNKSLQKVKKTIFTFVALALALGLLLPASSTLALPQKAYSLASSVSVLPSAAPSFQAPITTNPANPAKAITSFSFASPAVTGHINETNHTIEVAVPPGTVVTSLTPTIIHSGASVSPSGAQNFSSPIFYTVTAADASTVDYKVTVTVGYCSSTHSPVEEYISRVKLNSGDRFSGLGTLGYEDLTGEIIPPSTTTSFTSLNKGSTFPIQVTGENPNPIEYTEFVKVWVDFNQDYDFMDPGEGLNLGNYQFTGNTVFSGGLTIPGDAKSGVTRMRVVMTEDEAPTSCSTQPYSETEDYTVNIIEAPDLTVTVVTLTPPYPSNDAPFDVNFTVKNVGVIDSGPYRNYIYIDDKPIVVDGCPTNLSIDYTENSGLAAGNEEIVSVAISGSGLSAGLHAIYVYTDAECAVAEGYEENNSYGPVGGSRYIYLPLIMK